MRTSRGHAAVFATYVAASLVPVVALGISLNLLVGHEVDQRALAEAVSRAETIADASIEPVLAGADLERGVTDAERAELTRVTSSLHGEAGVLRLRIRTPEGSIVFDAEHPRAPIVAAVDEEVEEAASGTPVRVLTTVGADEIDGGSTAGAPAVESYVAFHAPGNRRVIGVLETYLPYEPFRLAAQSSKRHLSEVIAIGLLMLWGVLAVVSWSLTGRLRRSSEANSWLARHDQLTGLPNRVAFAELVAEACEGPEGATVSVLDIARFREVNETLGHGNADELLRLISSELRAAIPSDMSLARLGGDEFGVVSIGRDGHAVEDLHRRIQGVSGERFPIGGIDLGVEVVVGFAHDSDVARTDGGVLRAAELALHAAKELGVSPYPYDPSLDQFNPDRLALAGELGPAIAAGELVLHYQPKLDLTTGTVDSVEALVRWRHPDRGLVMPVDFVPLAESTSLMKPMTEWVISEAVRQMAAWRDEGIDVAVSVNVSARSLGDRDLPQFVLDALAAHAIPPARMKIEITETCIIEDPRRAVAWLRTLHEAGVRISLDDFGAGATSLASLAGLPLDEIKVDRAFVVEMDTSAERRAVVEFVISLGHRLGLKVVAEGIETEAAAADLLQMGCDEGQGYLYSRPIPADDLVAWLAHHERACAARNAATGGVLPPAAPFSESQLT